MADAHFFARQYNEAAFWTKRALRKWPNFHTAPRVAAASNALAGRGIN
jgi:hypothetical protein